MDYIKKYIQAKGSKDDGCSRVLGSKAKRDTVAPFYEKNAELVHLIAVDSLINYVLYLWNKYDKDARGLENEQ